jgi:hypothetical protein
VAANKAPYNWKEAICPSCGRRVWFTAPVAVATVPDAFAHLVPQTVMGECGHTVSVRFLDKPKEFAAANAARTAQQRLRLKGTA